MAIHVPSRARASACVQTQRMRSMIVMICERTTVHFEHYMHNIWRECVVVGVVDDDHVADQ